MNGMTFAEYELRTLSEDQLRIKLVIAESITDNPSQLKWLVYAELSRRHASVCNEVDCDFRPWD
jgi:hypothetical protein